MVLSPTPEGVLRPAWVSPALLEFFVHPATAWEVVTQSQMGVLKMEGRPGRAQVVAGPLGNGDLIVRVEFED